MRISDWSSDVCSSDLQQALLPGRVCNAFLNGLELLDLPAERVPQLKEVNARLHEIGGFGVEPVPALISPRRFFALLAGRKFPAATFIRRREDFDRSDEHTSELQSLMRISYAVFCLKKKKHKLYEMQRE